jgi:DEAD/DEAH box helicase domain-containing protein
VSSDNFVVQERPGAEAPRVIAEVDFDSAPALVHEKAVYIVEGRTYLVEKYEHQQRRAQVREAELDYYTQAVSSSRVRVIERFAEELLHGARRGHGEVQVTKRVVGFKKIKFWTNENVGSGELRMPENEMPTTAYWLTLPRELLVRLELEADERRDGVAALSHVLGQLAALFLLCDRHDLGVALGDGGQGGAGIGRGLARLDPAGANELPGPDHEPSVFLYDNHPGGVGLSEPLYRLHARLLAESLALVERCTCREGCPSCVGPPGEVGSRGKQVALALLRAMAPSG